MPRRTRLVCIPTPHKLDPLVAHVRRDLTPVDMTIVLRELADDVQHITTAREAQQAA